jgi:4-hydroxybenzoate polyprenyltransferase
VTAGALLQLARVPNVFTAMANVVAGVVLARGGRFQPRDLLLVLASAAFYTAGMVLNDYFDREVDARERPARPIPSGAVSARAAAALGALLLAVGLALAALASPRSLAVGGALAAAIVIYDAWVKGTALGPMVMGSCRLLNVALGLSAAAGAWRTFAWAPLAAGLYTAALTFVARDEVVGTPRVRGRIFVASMGALGAGLLAFAALAPLAAAALGFALLVLAGGARLFAPLWRETTGPRIGRAVGGGILMMPALDAVFVAGYGHPLAALLVLAFIAPAYALRRRFAMT